MNIVVYVFRQRMATAKRFYQTSGIAQKLVIFSFLLIITVVMAAEFLGFWRGFLYVRAQEFFGPPLALFILEEFFLLVAILFTASFIIAGFFIFFRPSDGRLLISTPTDPTTIFHLKLLETIGISSWPIFFMGIPLLLAFLFVYGGGLLLGILVIFLFCALMAFFSSLGGLVTFFAALLLERMPRFAFFILAVAAAFLLGFGVLHLFAPNAGTLSVVFEATNLEKSAATVTRVSELFQGLPSHWAALALFSSIAAPGKALLLIGFLFAGAGVLYALLLLAVGLFYRKLLLRSYEAASYSRADFHAGSRRAGGVFPIMFRGGVGAILEKDLLRMSRNYAELSRTGFMFFLLFIYMLVILGAGRRIGGFLAGSEQVVFAFHLVAISYFAAALSLRFVYPAVSLEGRGAWILWSSPVDRRALLRGKFIFFSGLLFFFMELLLFATASSFGAPLHSLLIASILLFALTLAIVAISLSLGTLFADFHESNVDRLSTSAGGILTTIFSITAGLIMGLTAFQALSPDGGGQVLVVSAGVLFSCLVAWLFLSIATRRIYRLSVS